MMKQYNLHLFTGLCSLSLLLSTGCSDDSTSDDGVIDESGDTSTDDDVGTTTDTDTDTDTDDDVGTTDTDGTDTDTGSTEETDSGTEETDTGTEETDTGSTAICGDMVIEDGEECEGEDFNGLTCADVGFMDGDLACADDCMFDYSGCNETVCGDGMQAGFEACDLEDFGDVSCESLGYTGGTLTCAEDCSAYDEAECFIADCGNGEIEGDEQCDGDVGELTCVDAGYGSGELGCNEDCTFNVELCDPCGNGVIDEGELCDGEALGDATCESEGFESGDLACNETCDAFVTDACVEGDGWWGYDFESGDMSAEWVLSGNADWYASTTSPNNGTYTGENGDIGNSQTSTMAVTLDFTQDGDVTFWYRVSTEVNYDYLRFYIDGTLQNEWSGVVAWSEISYPITTGQHTLTWTYYKDISVSSNSDTVWVDDITTEGGVLP
ncbi:hypothetical protein G6O69_29205 [Pseudenhygromyxa sp. WMMC2535]|uniref:hypothetical protein n=1 Tax=Pseudenhygromyxa sp. WMMC2535 TaxID=2712867 RepID=UPI0015532A49|nr:hypothetical protein [Pseudenhygromyxa sp. WMMC2535]NVB41943.1 hypothetical protein [Pseudenhygromyxa sp. WMMC2535]